MNPWTINNMVTDNSDEDKKGTKILESSISDGHFESAHVETTFWLIENKIKMISLPRAIKKAAMPCQSYCNIYTKLP